MIGSTAGRPARFFLFTGFALTLLLVWKTQTVAPTRAEAGSPTAAEGLRIITSTVHYSFAQQAVFTLEASSDAEIAAIHLTIQAAGQPGAHVSRSEFAPGRQVHIEHPVDLRFTPLPPFAVVEFWWDIQDASGAHLTTEPQAFRYEDNRFGWEELADRTDGRVKVHWIAGQGDLSFGQAALNVALSSLAEANVELRAPLHDVIDIYIYDGLHNLGAAMALTGRDWMVGQAHPELGVVLIAVPFQEGYTVQLQRDIPHELTHLLVYQAVTPAGYRYVPEWLDEGLAVANERLPSVEYGRMLEAARQQGRFIPLESLCVPFPPDPTTALLSYAQSGSLVKFIRAEYGAAGIRRLLAAYRDGASCKAGVREALGLEFDQLEARWRVSLEPETPWRFVRERVGVFLVIPLIGLATSLAMLGRRPRRRGRR